MKRTCNGCRALDIVAYNDYRCALGYKVENIIKLHAYVGAKPKEECSKLKTYDEYLSLRGY